MNDQSPAEQGCTPGLDDKVLMPDAALIAPVARQENPRFCTLDVVKRPRSSFESVIKPAKLPGARYTVAPAP